MQLNIILLALRFRYIRNLGNTIVNLFNQIKGLFATFGVIDFIDILFVAIIIYVVVRIIRETRAMQLIKGIVFILVFYLVVNFLGMGASSYLLKMIFSNILIIVVVLFGPEIRNILEQMGKGAARNSLRTILHSGVALEVAQIQKAIDSTVKACVEMSDTKTGALIVFENETLLGDVISTGTVVDAAATKELIENVFFPKSPLHDGAMIIRDGKIYAAGCILPLTRNNDLSSALGTRHRAALGLTEQSDAVVVVVSEETGSMSIAANGNLQRDVSSGMLFDTLVNQFVPSGSSSDDRIITKLVRRMKNNGK